MMQKIHLPLLWVQGNTLIFKVETEINRKFDIMGQNIPLPLLLVQRNTMIFKVKTEINHKFDIFYHYQYCYQTFHSWTILWNRNKFVFTWNKNYIKVSSKNYFLEFYSLTFLSYSFLLFRFVFINIRTFFFKIQILFLIPKILFLFSSFY